MTTETNRHRGPYPAYDDPDPYHPRRAETGQSFMPRRPGKVDGASAFRLMKEYQSYIITCGMRRIRIALLYLCGIISVASMAQDFRNSELASSNYQLNATYRALMRQPSAQDQNALRLAQKAWITFRDADCSFGFGDRRDCRMQCTDEREKQLRDSTYFDTRGKLINMPDPIEQ